MITDQENITDPVCKMQLRPEQIRETVVIDGQLMNSNEI
jgi:YHS domain-containing protein